MFPLLLFIPSVIISFFCIEVSLEDADMPEKLSMMVYLL
jgi:hypothetical protein